MKLPKIQFSKLIGLFSGLLFLSQIAIVGVVALKGGDATFAWYTVPATGTVFATWYVSYANKEKPANIFKLRVGYMDHLIDRENDLEKQLEIVQKERAKAEEMFEDYSDSKSSESLHSENEIQNI